MSCLAHCSDKAICGSAQTMARIHGVVSNNKLVNPVTLDDLLHLVAFGISQHQAVVFQNIMSTKVLNGVVSLF